MNRYEAVEKVNEEVTKLEIVIITYQNIIQTALSTEWADSIMIAGDSIVSEAKERIKSLLQVA